MNELKQLRWPLILGLGAFALLRPLLSMSGLMDTLGKPQTPLLATLVVSVVWIAVVALLDVARPLLTLVFAGLAYGLFTIVLSSIMSPFLTGQVQGPLATPFGVGIVAVLIVNAIWGAVAGTLALLVQQIRQRPGTR
jgi:hypothetical protein